MNELISNFLNVVKFNYLNFDGRARRREYWLYGLAMLIISIICNVIDAAIGLPVTSTIISLGLLLPGIALSVRRLHDINKSGWMLLISLIPLVGALILLYFSIKEGDKGNNQYGPDPKALA